MKFSAFKERFQNLPYFTHQSIRLLSEPLQTLRNQVALWEKRGEIIHLKRGWYTLSEKERKVPLDRLVLATHMVTPSYLSLEWALAHYGFIPEYTPALTVVTTQKTQAYQTPVGSFFYHHIKIPLFTGFVEYQTPEGFRYLIAEPEKALVDFLYFRLAELDPQNPDHFELSFRFQNLDRLNWKKMYDYAELSKIKKLKAVVRSLRKWCRSIREIPV